LLTTQPPAIEQRHSYTTAATLFLAPAVGAVLWWWLIRTQGQDLHTLNDGPAHWSGLAVALAICLIPPLRRRIARVIEQLRQASPRAVRIMTVVVFVSVPTYLMLTAFRQYRDLFPRWHDQQMLLVQAQMLARGRLWMPQHPCADFFETFYMFVKPLYAPIYFPGGAMFFVPTVWLHLPVWLQPLLLSGALAALLFRIVSELIDPAAALLAAAYLTSLWVFRLLSLWEMSHTVFLLLALWAIWSWMRWRKRSVERNGDVERNVGLAWAASIGVAMGWAAITRPLDAVAYALPLAVALLWDLRRDRWGKRLATAAIILVAAAPFLTIQLIFDRKLTGRWLQTPFQHYYVDVEFTGLSPTGSMPAPDAHATSHLPQKQLFARLFVLPTEREFAAQSLGGRLSRRAGRVGVVTIPSGLLLLLLPAGLMAMRDPRRLVVFTPVIIFTVLYAFYPLMLDHYCLTVAPGVILCVLLGSNTVATSFPLSLRERVGVRAVGKAPVISPHPDPLPKGEGDAMPPRRRFVSTFLSLAILSLLLTSLPEFQRWFTDSPEAGQDDSSWPAVTFNYEVLPEQVKQPALVLYRYWKLTPGEVRNFNDEPVYNVDAAWPDFAPIIRAHDLGDRDTEIIDYYAAHQPDRNVYIVDRKDLEQGIHHLGTAGELARRLGAGEAIGKILPPP